MKSLLNKEPSKQKYDFRLSASYSWSTSHEYFTLTKAFGLKLQILIVQKFGRSLDQPFLYSYFFKYLFWYNIKYQNVSFDPNCPLSYFTLSNARRFYLSMESLWVGKG